LIFVIKFVLMAFSIVPRFFSIVILLMVFCVELCAGLAPAQAVVTIHSAWPAGGVKVSGFSSDAVSHRPQVVDDGEGNFVVLWRCNWGGSLSLVAQKLNKSGLVLWGQEGVEVIETTLEVKTAKLVKLGSGEVGVVWDCWNADGKSWTFAQKLSRSGQKLWHPDGMFVIAAGGSYFSPDAAADGEGGLLVVLTAYEDPRFRNDILAQHLGVSGKRLWANTGILVSANISDQVASRLVVGEDGQAIVCWVDYRNGVNNADIYAQKIDREGNTVWDLNGMEVCRAADMQQAQQVISDNAGGAIIVWEDNGAGNYDIFAQRLDTAGRAQWKKDGELVCGTFGDQKALQIVSDGAGGVLVVWQDYRIKGWNIFAQRLDSQGKRVWEEDGISVCFEVGAQASPGLVSDGRGNYLTAWEDYRSKKGYAVYAQVFDGNGKILLDKNGILLSDKEHPAREMVLAADPVSDTYLVVWEAFLPEGRGICAQKISGHDSAKASN
jgi:hypothetical protein